jgi:hypothetical protein
VWQTTTRETRAVYPAGGRPLAPGEYAWEVLARDGSRKGLDTAPFTVAAPRQVAAVRRALERAAALVADSDVPNLARIAVCLEHRLYPEAETLLQRATARSPRDRVLWALRMRLYELTERSAEREATRPILIDLK